MAAAHVVLSLSCLVLAMNKVVASPSSQLPVPYQESTGDSTNQDLTEGHSQAIPIEGYYCFSKCGSQSTFGCFCDSYCNIVGDCCSDYWYWCPISPFPEVDPVPPAPPAPPAPPVTCEGFCGGQNSFQFCWCDDLCTFYDDCCPDAVESCLSNPSSPPSPPTPPSPPIPPSPPAPSCVGICGELHLDDYCSCDDLCTFFLDCCQDAIETCFLLPPSPPSPSPPPPQSCAGYCGEAFIPSGQCSCNELCTVLNICCFDASILCFSPSPPPPVESPPSPVIPSCYPLGDVNLDEDVTVIDVVDIVNSILGLAPVTGVFSFPGECTIGKK